MSNFQFMMADEHFTNNCDFYSKINIGTKQLLVSLQNQDYPIYQVYRVCRPYASIIGNYCVSDSSILLIQKVDPLFLCLLIFPQLFTTNRAVDYESLFNEAQDINIKQLANYLKGRKSIKDRIGQLCKVTSALDDIYYQPTTQLLFEFLDKKRSKITAHLEGNQCFNLVSMRASQQKEDDIQDYSLIGQYLSKELAEAYCTTRGLVQTLVKKQVQDDYKSPAKGIQNSKGQSKPKPKSTSADIKNANAAKNCASLNSFFTKPKQKE